MECYEKSEKKQKDLIAKVKKRYFRTQNMHMYAQKHKKTAKNDF